MAANQLSAPMRVWKELYTASEAVDLLCMLATRLREPALTALHCSTSTHLANVALPAVQPPVTRLRELAGKTCSTSHPAKAAPSWTWSTVTRLREPADCAPKCSTVCILLGLALFLQLCSAVECKQMMPSPKPKRKAISPCENLKTKPKLAVSPIIIELAPRSTSDSSTESFMTAKMNNSDAFAMDQSVKLYDNFSVRVATKNGEVFEGALDRPQCVTIWNSLQLEKSLLYGICLIQTPNKPFMAKFQLSEDFDVDLIESELKVRIGDDEYGMVVVPPREPPQNWEIISPLL